MNLVKGEEKGLNP